MPKRNHTHPPVSKRDAFYEKYPHFHHTIANEHNLRYGLYQSYGITHALRDEIKYASERLYTLLKQLEAHIIEDADTHAALGFTNISPFLTYETALPMITCRFDIMLTPRNDAPFQFIELNHDTPFLVLENTIMDAQLNHALGHESTATQRYTRLQQALYTSIQEAATFVQKPLKNCTIRFWSTTKEENIEEYNQHKLYQTMLKQKDIHSDLIHYDDVHICMNTKQAYDRRNGQRIDILLKLGYPYEYLINSTYADAPDAYFGHDLLTLHQNKHIALLPSPHAHILQNKTIFAYASLCAQHHTFFIQDDCAFIRKYLPETSFTPLTHQQAYVQKPILSREGRDIVIYQQNGTQHNATTISPEKDTVTHPVIYQAYVPPTIERIITDDRPETFTAIDTHLILGVFLVQQEFNGIVARYGDAITTKHSYWSAVHVHRTTKSTP